MPSLRGNRVSALGASQVARTGVAKLIEGDGFMYYVWYGAETQGRIVYQPVEAVAGSNLATTLSLVPNFDSHPALYGAKPDWCILQAGGNDLDNAPSGYLPTVDQIIDALLNRDIQPVITANFVSDPGVGHEIHKKHRAIYNTGLALMARKRGLHFIDPNPRLVDVTTGGFLSGLSSDGLHVDPPGGKLAGEYIADKFLNSGGQVPHWDTPLAYANDADTVAAYKYTNPLLLSESATPGIPTGFSANATDSGTISYALVDGAADGVLGKWWQITKSASTGETILTLTISSPTVGNKYAVGWKQKWDYVSGSGTQIAVELRNQASDNLYRTYVFSNEDLGVSTHWFIEGVPVGSTSLQFRVRMGAVGTFSIGQITIMDLSAQGIAPWIG